MYNVVMDVFDRSRREGRGFDGKININRCG